jgi:hypothetical protein
MFFCAKLLQGIDKGTIVIEIAFLVDFIKNKRHSSIIM